MWNGFERNLRRIPQTRQAKYPLKCFHDDLVRISPYLSIDAGIRGIDVERITGSVNKYNVLDQHFRNVRNTTPEELDRIKHLDRTLYGFKSAHHPTPLHVYLLQHDYYVIDGHRRVACAKAHGVDCLDAHVTECVPQNDPGIDIQREFDRKTDLHHLILLNHKQGYRTLLRGVSEFPVGTTTAKKAETWFRKMFSPCVHAIRLSPLSRKYPDFLAEDIYVLIMEFYYDILGDIPPKASPHTLISGYLFASKIDAERAFRTLPSRIMLRVFKSLIFRGAR